MKPRRNKRNPTIDAKIRAARQQGASFKELSARFGLSEGTISNVLAAPSSSAAPAPAAPVAAPAPSEQPASAPTREELIGFLTEQARGLRVDIANMTDASPRAAANRNLVAVQALISRLLPPEPPSESVGVFCSTPELQEIGGKAWARMREVVEKMREGATACPTCGCLKPRSGP